MHKQRSRSFIAGAVLVTAMSLAGGVGAASAAGHHAAKGHPVTLRDGHGIKVKSVKVIESRQLLATIAPSALAPKTITVRILLPVGYRPDAKPRYPVLYLFPGTSGHSYDWMTVGDAPKTMKPYRLITVSSDIGFDGDGGSWFTNWVNQHTQLGKSQWEFYDIHQLIPWIDQNLNTIRSRSGRAVAGLSMGGYGATELAARHPDMFVQQASFSGAPEIDRDLEARVGAHAVIGATMMGLNGVSADAPFGNHVTNEINWQGHDPARMIDNLRPVKLWFALADGTPGVYDDPVTDPGGFAGAAAVESLTHTSTTLFLKHLREENMSATVYDYGAGTHTWPYWARDLRKFVSGTLVKTFANPPKRPAAISYKTINPRWKQWGWSVSIKRTAHLEWSALRNAGMDGFRFAGSGVATVVTPPYPKSVLSFKVEVGGHWRAISADRAGRLHIKVPLGSKPHIAAVRIAYTFLPQEA